MRRTAAGSTLILDCMLSRIYSRHKQFLELHLLAFFALIGRLTVSFISERINHPDEIFQYLEQAHRLVFGYGYIPWEYRFGTRSWILPGFISGILYVCKALGIDDPAIYIGVVQVVFCFLSVSLVYSLYILAREISGETAGRLAALFGCIWYELLYFADKPNPEILSTYLIIAALAITARKPSNRNAALVGMFAGTAVAFRIHYLPALAIVGLFACGRWKKQAIAVAALTLIAFLAVAGWVDYLTWGDFWASYYNNYLYNSVYRISELFGTSPFYHYLKSLTIASAGLFAITGLLGLFKLHRTWLPVTMITSIIIFHSFVPHKEYRFVFITIPIFLILLAILVAEKRSARQKQITGTVVILVSFLSVAGLLTKLPWQNSVLANGVPLLAQPEILQAYLFLNKESQLGAILNIAKPWYATGGYYYLHRNVPIYSANQLGSTDNLGAFVSHVVCSPNENEMSGFAVVRRIGKLEIRRRTILSSTYTTLNIDTKNALQNGIDDKFTPTVKKRF
jgi:GPI mannosyltransferase 3